MANATARGMSFTSTDHQTKIITSEADFVVAMSPRGEGKTTTCLMACIYWAKKLSTDLWPIKLALVRDTRKNLGNTTGKTIREWFPPLDSKKKMGYSQWRGKEGEWDSCTIWESGKPLLEIHFFGVDNQQDLNRFQSFESAMAWIEEPAPAADVTSGVSEEAFALATTCLRQVPGFGRVYISMNPPSRQDWVARLFLNDFQSMDITEEEREAIQHLRNHSEVVQIPKGENLGVTQWYRERNRIALLAAGRSDLVARLVEGQVSDIQLGEAATPEFSPDHLVEGLLVNPYSPLILLHDFGLYPTCLVTQMLPTGHWAFHKAWAIKNIGTKQLMEQYVHPWLMNQDLEKGVTWSHIGGWEGLSRDQSNSEETPVRTMLRIIGGTKYTPGPIPWPERRDSAKEALLKRISGGVPWVRINGEACDVLVRALQGGAHYRKTPDGQVHRDGLVKNDSSHPFDAYAAGCAVLLKRPESEVMDHFKRKQKNRQRQFTNNQRSRTGA